MALTALVLRDCAEAPRGPRTPMEEIIMGKTGRKRRARRKKGANHGKRPNS
ncbi:hypothetical protein GCM10010197_44130 [Nocardioides luteus]|uniref:Uncharacterized protein n=4 Tax=Nocardioides TaxID=1839 RepID=A0ABQ5SWP8_9ACTN|nr:hypothetical protein GCM10010197_44130 [Nocardioides luteus]GLJ68040.1 hypothetical protein GCM10017579_20760 [Nocardioides luteus]